MCFPFAVLQTSLAKLQTSEMRKPGASQTVSVQDLWDWTNSVSPLYLKFAEKVPSYLWCLHSAVDLRNSQRQNANQLQRVLLCPANLSTQCLFVQLSFLVESEDTRTWSRAAHDLCRSSIAYGMPGHGTSFLFLFPLRPWKQSRMIALEVETQSPSIPSSFVLRLSNTVKKNHVFSSAKPAPFTCLRLLG